MALLIDTAPGDHVRRVLQHTTEVGEGHHIGELREERGVLDDDGEEEELMDEVLLARQMLLRELQLALENGYLKDTLELLLQPDDLQKAGIGRGVAAFGFAEGSPEVVELRLGEEVVELSPEGLDRHLDLGDGQEAALDDLTLRVAELRLKVLYVVAEVHLRVHPEGTVHIVDEDLNLGVLEGLVLRALIENHSYICLAE